MEILITLVAVSLVGIVCLLFWVAHQFEMQVARKESRISLGIPEEMRRILQENAQRESGLSGARWVIVTIQLVFVLWGWGSAVSGNIHFYEEMAGDATFPISIAIGAGTLFAIWVWGRSDGYRTCLHENMLSTQGNESMTGM